MGLTRAIALPSKGDTKLSGCIEMHIDNKRLSLIKKHVSREIKLMNNETRAEHGCTHGYLAGNGIYVVALNFLNILQFFSCKSIKN